MHPRALKLALLFVAALLASVASPRYAEAGVILSPTAASASIDLTGGVGVAACPSAPGPEIHGRGALDVLPVGSFGCGAPPSTVVTGILGMLTMSPWLPIPSLMARLLLDIKLVFPNPPPLGLLRPPCC